MTKEAYSCQNLGNPKHLKYYNASFPNVILLDSMLDLPQEKINKITMQLLWIYLKKLAEISKENFLI